METTRHRGILRICKSASFAFVPAALHQIPKQQLSAAAAMEKRRQACRSSITSFIQSVGRDEQGQPLHLSPMHLSWHRHVDYCWTHGLKCMILAHFGSGKSSAFLVPLAAFSLGRELQSRIKVISNSDDSARKRVNSAKQMIASTTYRWVFPEVKPGLKWTDSEIFIQRRGQSIDPSIHARGVNTPGIGGRADILLFDDVCDQINTATEDQRRKVLAKVEQTWMTRLEPGNEGRVLWIATPWHVNDATASLMQTPGWCTLIQKASPDCTHFTQQILGALPGVPYPNFGVSGDWLTP